MSPERFDAGLLLGAVVLLLGIAGVRLSVRTGLPSLVLYVGLGMLLGPQALGLPAVDPELARLLGYGALVIILAEGGITSRWSALRPAALGAAMLATVGVAVSVLVTAGAAQLLLDVSWRNALLLGAVLAPTDAAAVFSVLRVVPLPQRVASLLEAESGLNDAPTVLLVVTLSATELPTSAPDVGLVGLEVALELAGGALVGYLVGRLAVIVLHRIALPASGLYPIAAFAHVVLAYGAAAVLHASGFLAVYIAALALGGARLPHGPATRGFAEGLAWLAQIGLFVMLGMLVTPSRLPAALLPALGVGAALLLLARPLSVIAALAPLRVPWPVQAFTAWAGLRGAVPIVLATVPTVAGVEGSEDLIDVVFTVVVISTLVQAPLLGPLARRLGLAGDELTRDLAVEASPLGRLGADLLQLRVPPGSRLAGVEVFELRLPAGAAITLIVRDGTAFVPGPNTPLRQDDELLLVATAAVRLQAEERLRAISRSGRLAGWYGEDGR